MCPSEKQHASQFRRTIAWVSRPIFLLLRRAALCGEDKTPSTLNCVQQSLKETLSLGLLLHSSWEKLGSVSSSPHSWGCFYSRFWDHMARPSRAGPKSDCSGGGKPDADRRTWRKSSGRGRRSAYLGQSPGVLQRSLRLVSTRDSCLCAGMVRKVQLS